jgi:hypothetical protein
MADAAAGHRLQCHVVGRPLQGPDLVRAEDVTHDEQPVAVELVDLFVCKHAHLPSLPMGCFRPRA